MSNQHTINLLRIKIAMFLVYQIVHLLIILVIYSNADDQMQPQHPKQHMLSKCLRSFYWPIFSIGHSILTLEKDKIEDNIP